MLGLEDGNWLVGVFVAASGGAFVLVPSLRSLLKVPLLLFTLFVIAQFVRRVLRLSPNVNTVSFAPGIF
ncbi:unnamed protein product [Gongylonema pulchrum]|uniref:Membrane transporter protein n=1 Tax=Gongylonema pulchrum TaxID=637853 RepID=A0A183E7L2_9BILA|nr:unnamed protein product [Gongylonema pulchrum]